MNTKDFRQALRNASFPTIIGQEEVKDQLKSTLIMGRHVILVGPPGVGKTTLVRGVAEALPEIEVVDCGCHCLPDKPACPSCLTKKNTTEPLSAVAQSSLKKVSGASRFVRVQGSPDLTAEDLLGDIDPIKALTFGPLSLEAFTPGKIFKANNGVLFFDEINRCSEKLQNALLQVLEEGKLTIGSYDVDFEASFVLIGTMNPDDNSTEALSDVFLDRFDLVTMTYPATHDLEKEIVRTQAQQFVPVPNTITDAIVDFVRSMRADTRLEKVPSVRATLGLYERAQSNAYLSGKDKVTFEDLGRAVDSVIAHRIRLKPSVQFVVSPEQFVKARYDEFMTEHEAKGDVP